MRETWSFYSVIIIITKCLRVLYFLVKSYKSQYEKWSYKNPYFCPFNIVNLYFDKSNKENSYKHTL